MWLFLLAIALAAPVQMPTRAADKIITGQLAEGELASDLSWAQNAAVACLPSTRWSHIQGKTVYLDDTVPAGKAAYIRVTPKSGQDLAIFVIVDGKGAGTPLRPPRVESANSCAKSYWGKPGEAEWVEIPARPLAQTLIIAVAGSEGVTEGSYELELWVQ